MGHVQFILDLKNQPEKYSSPAVPHSSSAGKADVQELKHLINVWNNEINLLKTQIERYKIRLSSRKLSSDGRRWMRDIIREYQKSIAEFELKRSNATTKLNISR